MSASAVRRVLPALTWLSSYRRAWLPRDLVAGLTVWALVVPEAMAYAGIAGVPVQFGLYAVPLALVGYAAFGSCRELVVGPTAAIASMSAATVGGLLVAGSDSRTYVALTGLLALVVGGLYLVGGLLRLGFVASFFARPVLDGFIIGLGIYVAVGQLPKLVGIEKPDGDTVSVLVHTLGSVADWNRPDLLVGLAAVGLLVGLRLVAPRVPAAIVVVLLALVAGPLLDLESRGVAVVGHVPSGFGFVPWSTGLTWTDLPGLVSGAAAIVIVGFAQSVAIAKSYAAESHEDLDANEEMIGYGAANLGAGLLQGYAVAGSLSKSAAAHEARSRTPLTSVVAAALVLVTILFLAPLFDQLPEAVLAAIVIEAVSGMLRPARLTALWRVRTVELAAATGALLGVVVVGIMSGVIIGVAVSFALLISALDHPRISRLGVRPGDDRYVDLAEHPDAVAEPGVLVERFEAPLVFINADLFKARMIRWVHHTDPPAQVLVLDLEAVTQVDVTGASALVETTQALAASGVRVLLGRPHGAVREQLARAGVLAVIGEEHVHSSVAEAVEAARAIVSGA